MTLIAEDIDDSDSLIAAAERLKEIAARRQRQPRRRQGDRGAHARVPPAAEAGPADQGEVSAAPVAPAAGEAGTAPGLSGSLAAAIEAKPQRRRPARPRKPKVPEPIDSGLRQDLTAFVEDTRGRLRGIGVWGVTALLAAATVAIVSVTAVLRMSAGAVEARLLVRTLDADGSDADSGVPRQLFERWLASFPDRVSLANEPTTATLEAFAQHLAAQAEIAAVPRVARDWRLDPDGGEPQRLVAVDLRLRSPALPLMLETGEMAWVDAEGRILSGSLPGPIGEPLLRGLARQSGLAAVKEVLAVWPRLRSALPAGLVSEIHLDAALGQDPSDRGIVLITKPGTRLIWGRAQEDRFGVSLETKIRNLGYTLHCQGDLRRIAAVNVRFPEPKVLVRGEPGKEARG